MFRTTTSSTPQFFDSHRANFVRSKYDIDDTENSDDEKEYENDDAGDNGCNDGKDNDNKDKL